MAQWSVLTNIIKPTWSFRIIIIITIIITVLTLSADILKIARRVPTSLSRRKSSDVSNDNMSACADTVALATAGTDGAANTGDEWRVGTPCVV